MKRAAIVKRVHKEKKADELLPYRNKIAVAMGDVNIDRISCERCPADRLAECQWRQSNAHEVLCELTDADADIKPTTRYQTDYWLNEMHEDLLRSHEPLLGKDNLDDILIAERRKMNKKGRGVAPALHGKVYPD